jgi:F0F1-type ATP synthase assembly protein I
MVGSPKDVTESAQSELRRRHKAAATTVGSLLIAVVLVSVIAYLGKKYFRQQPNPSLDVGLRIVILILGLGAVALRRTRFSTMRLQDIGALKGATGLLTTLEKTTLQLAILGAGIAALGFSGTLFTGNDIYTYWAGLIAIVVLVYCYPSRKSWERTVQQFAPYGNSQLPSM